MGIGNNGVAQFLAATTNSRIDWVGTLRARLGFTVAPTFLVYATGGLAYGGVKSNVTPIFVNTTGGSLIGVTFVRQRHQARLDRGRGR